MTAYISALIRIIAFFVGQVLVTRRHWAGLLVWAASNLVVLTACVVTQDVSTAMMFVVYQTPRTFREPSRASRQFLPQR